jgi:uncharacterized repeat protein (TIGR02543 family)
MMNLNFKPILTMILVLFVSVLMFACENIPNQSSIIITFDSMGGAEVSALEIEVGQTAVLPEPEKVGFAFLGWTVNNNQMIIDESYVFNQSKTLYASWQLVSYSIIYHHTLNANIDHLVKSYTILDDDFYIDAIQTAGFSFIGWYTNQQLSGEPITMIETGSYGEVNLYAKWETNLYSITYHQTLDANISSLPTTYSILERVVLPNIEVDGYQFLGWFVDNQGEAIDVINIGSYGDIDLYARWESIIEPFYFFPQDILYDGPILNLDFLNIVAYGSYGEGNPYRGTGGAYYVDFDPSQGIGRCIDGDTTVFYYPNDIFTKITSSAKSVRYFNIDTPETRPIGNEEKWGHMASYYVCDILNEAEAYILQSDPGDNFLDRHGRLLAWVWIRMPGETEFWLLNYMVLRQGLGEVRYLFGAGETDVTVYDGYTYLAWLYYAQNKAIQDGFGMHGLGMDYYWNDQLNRPNYNRLR